jgi:hypothetical protein
MLSLFVTTGMTALDVLKEPEDKGLVRCDTVIMDTAVFL